MKKGLIAISPIIVFIFLYLISSLIIGDFGKMPLTVSFMLCSMYAISVTRGISFNEKIEIFSKGAGQNSIMLILWIFILSGAFASSAKGMGSVEETVKLTLKIVPSGMILSGLFLSSCFVSISIGTSVGTIVALTPIAIGISEATNADLCTIVALIVGGSFFGDNLSFISDTTIIATQSQGCRMKDKFLENIKIVTPAAIITLIIYIILGNSINAPAEASSINFIKILPYILVIVTALLGAHVLLVLTLGLFSTGIIGILTGDYNFFSWCYKMGDGIVSMGELIIITMMAGGLLAIIKWNGGINYIIKILTSNIKQKKSAELCIGILVSAVNMCTANNTVALITVADITKNISEKFDISPKRTASLMDTFSCTTQGLLPYGAQVLIACGLAGVSPMEIVGKMYYIMILGTLSLLYIFIKSNSKVKVKK